MSLKDEEKNLARRRVGKVNSITTSRKDPALCMVTDCHRKALYRGGRSATSRGYCAQHKAFATTGANEPRDTANLSRWFSARNLNGD